ncbi:MAG: homocysteine biosynthesis protein, partial [Desulfovibrionaceae bacterium]|nr:homocysteine biosynthesis protein [Desulfovibrionaceae bacterium]
TLMVKGNLKDMNPRYIRGLSLIGYGCSLAVGVGIPIPILDADMAWFTGVDDCDILMPVKDYGHDYPNGVNRILQHVAFEELKSGEAKILDTRVETVPLTSLSLSLEIADTLKKRIREGKFLLTEPVEAITST